MLGLSGGCDSIALLHLAHAWLDHLGPERRPALRAVHIHHGLAPEADAWVEVCQDVCQQLSIALSVYRVTPVTDEGKGIEAAARTARYSVYRQELKSGEVLLLAHHADDQVETVLQRLLRGTGPKGFAGMPRRRELGQGVLSRPLLGVARSVIKRWADNRELAYVIDASNQDVRFDRGFLRTEILPKLEQRWPGYRESIRRATELQSGLLRQHNAQPLALTANVMGEPAMAYHLKDSAQDSRGVLAYSLHRWLSELLLDVPAAARLTEFVRQCYEARTDRCPEVDVGRGMLRAWRGLICFTPYFVEEAQLSATLVAGQVYEGSWGTVTWAVAPKNRGFYRGETVTVRYRAAGERFRMDAEHTRDFGTLCQAHDIPPWWRSRLPIFARDGTTSYIPVIGSLWELNQGAPAHSERLLPQWQPIKPSPWN